MDIQAEWKTITLAEGIINNKQQQQLKQCASNDRTGPLPVVVVVFPSFLGLFSSHRISSYIQVDFSRIARVNSDWK